MARSFVCWYLAIKLKASNCKFGHLLTFILRSLGQISWQDWIRKKRSGSHFPKKRQRINKVMRIHPLGTTYICTKCHGNLSNSYLEISLWIKVMDWNNPRETKETGDVLKCTEQGPEQKTCLSWVKREENRRSACFIWAVVRAVFIKLWTVWLKVAILYIIIF